MAVIADRVRAGGETWNCNCQRNCAGCGGGRGPAAAAGGAPLSKPRPPPAAAPPWQPSAQGLARWVSFGQTAVLRSSLALSRRFHASIRKSRKSMGIIYFSPGLHTPSRPRRRRRNFGPPSPSNAPKGSAARRALGRAALPTCGGDVFVAHGISAARLVREGVSTKPELLLRGPPPRSSARLWHTLSYTRAR